MLDTIKVGIAITENQYKKLVSQIAIEDKWQWIMFNPKAGELRFLKQRGLAQLDRESFRREIFWDVPEFYDEEGTYLTLEFSVPKYWYGHNIHLLHDYVTALEELRKLLQKQFHLRLPKVDDWKVWRADICYAWRCPSERIAEAVLDSIKKMSFPRKRPHIYGSSIMFAGTTYSLKFYLKLPEFIAHDRKALLKADASLEWVNHLEQKAEGVLRCEATLRRKYLQRQNIDTVKDLTGTETFFNFDAELVENYPDIETNALERVLVMSAIGTWIYPDTKIDWGNGQISIQGDFTAAMMKGGEFSAPAFDLVIGNSSLPFKGGGFQSVVKPRTVVMLDRIVTKLVGEHKGMETVEHVREKLNRVYKPHKASRLLGFWLFVQRLGIKQAKADYGRDSFYDAKKALKKAGVSLVEPVKLINAEDKFIKEFGVEIPSEYVTNKFDDYRGSDNLLNLPSKEA